MKIIYFIIFTYFVICQNAVAASVSLGAGASSGTFSGMFAGTNMGVFGQVHSVGDPRFDSRWGNLTGVTISVDIQGDFYVGDLVDHNTPLTAIGFFGAWGNFPCDCVSLGYTEALNVSGYGFVKYVFNQTLTKEISESDWSKFVRYDGDRPWQSFTGGGSRIDISISPDSEVKRFVGMSVSESASIVYQYDEPPLAPGVPEPASCALMIIGLGALAYMNRRSHRNS